MATFYTCPCSRLSPTQLARVLILELHHGISPYGMPPLPPSWRSLGSLYHLRGAALELCQLHCSGTSHCIRPHSASMALQCSAFVLQWISPCVSPHVATMVLQWRSSSTLPLLLYYFTVVIF
eukprot:5336350-Amphidinium_carterae.1